MAQRLQQHASQYMQVNPPSAHTRWLGLASRAVSQPGQSNEGAWCQKEETAPVQDALLTLMDHLVIEGLYDFWKRNSVAYIASMYHTYSFGILDSTGLSLFLFI